jgi:integrase
LRNTAASLAISAGANVKAVQRMLGHASAAVTLDTYADLFGLFGFRRGGWCAEMPGDGTKALQA